MAPAGVLLHDAFLFALPGLLAFVGALFEFALAAGERERALDAAAREVKVKRHERVARALHAADQLHDFAAVHEELARAVRFERFVRADLVGRIHVGVAEKEFAVADVDVREIDLGAPGAHGLHFPAAQHEPGLEFVFDRIVEAGAFVDDLCHNFVFLVVVSNV